MSKHLPQSENMKALEHSLNDHMEICSLKRKAKRLKAENARLKAEVERLRSSSFVTAVPVEQYERLVAGGELVLREWSMGNEKGANNYLKALVIWNAAKEGKQP